MNLCGLQALGQRQGWQDAGQTLGQHGFAASRRTDHHEIVAACCCNFQGTLDALLSFDIRKVELVVVLLLIEFTAGVDDGGFIAGIAV